jgi:DNA polymerase III delta subunit
VLGEAAALGLTLEEEAFDVLFLIHGEQTSNILNEVRKAAYVVEGGAAITQDVILTVCGRRHAAAPWSVSEAAFAKEPKRALRAIALLVQERGDEALVPIAAALMRQLETFVVLRQMLDQQASPDTMGAALGLHPYRVQKDLPAVKRHTLPQLLNQMKNLCDLEAHLKGPATAKRTRVELAVLSLAA